MFLWWDILKNAKISGKAKGKGTSFDASKIKINIDKDDCKRELKEILSKALDMSLSKVDFTRLNKKFIDNELSEKRACEFVKTLKYKLPTLVFREFGMNIRVGSHPPDYVRYDKIIVRKERELVVAGKKREEYHVSLTGQNKELVDGGQRFTLFAKFTFATKEEYTKWVKSI